MLSGGMMGDAYGWVKVVHILAVVSWMAGLFYLPRLFVYHAENEEKIDLIKVFKVMERRLLRAIMRPAAAVSVARRRTWWPFIRPNSR